MRHTVQRKKGREELEPTEKEAEKSIKIERTKVEKRVREA